MKDRNREKLQSMPVCPSESLQARHLFIIPLISIVEKKDKDAPKGVFDLRV